MPVLSISQLVVVLLTMLGIIHRLLLGINSSVHKCMFHYYIAQQQYTKNSKYL